MSRAALLSVLLILAVSVNGAQPSCTEYFWPTQFKYPNDYSIHFRALSDTYWWLANVWTTDGSNQRFAFNLDAWRWGCGVPIEKLNATSNFAFTDPSIGGHCYNFNNVPFPGFSATSADTSDPFVFSSTPGFSVTQTDQQGLQFRLQAGPIADCFAPGQSVSVDVTLSIPDLKTGIMLVGHDGFERSFNTTLAGGMEYDHPSMKTEGTIQYGNRTLKVQGRTWLQHQWHTFFIDPFRGKTGWDWFAADFDNGVSFAFVAFWADDSQNTTYGALSYGNLQYSLPNGTLVNELYYLADVQLQRLDACPSAVTGITYWCRHSFNIPKAQLQFTTSTIVRSSEIVWPQDYGNRMGISEAASDIVGTWQGQPVRGVGWTENFGHPKQPVGARR